VIRPLSDPAAFGGHPQDAFDVVVPSLPEYGFSTPLSTPGLNYWRTADLWVKLMSEGLGYDRFGAQGGDWGAWSRPNSAMHMPSGSSASTSP
jgi:pimeloyl-ACP methyl ester carboxylesterase